METYKTKQRESVFSCLKDNSEKALTVDNIVDFLKQRGTPVGKTTVYRHLDKLVTEGCVRKFVTQDGTGATFQFMHNHQDCEEHFHLKCSCCGELVHLGCEFMKGIDEHIFSHHGFKVDNSKTVLYGICRKCSERQDI